MCASTSTPVYRCASPRATCASKARAGDPELQAARRTFAPLQGEIFDHRRYEASKSVIERLLSERGYFDARPAGQEVIVTRAERSAEVDVGWDSGERYVFGEVEVGEHQLRPGLIEKLVPWEPGEPYHQSYLLELQQTLTDLDYFAVIDITPAPRESEGLDVPVQVSLTPAKRSIYSAGLGYGTDSGAGIQLGFERRWVNTRGHKWRNVLDWSQRRQLLTTQYRIPAFDQFAGWYTGAFNLRREITADIDTELIEAVVNRTGQIGLWTVSAGLHAQRERYRFGEQEEREYATLVFPALRAQTSRGDDPLYPTRGWSLVAEIKAGSEAIGSGTDFVQAYLQGRYVMSFGESTRLLLRAELGTTSSDSFETMPPSLRFFAGGDRSVRGYGFKELGPRVDDVVVGGENLSVLSIEVERMFTDTWGAAVFIDAGNAFNSRGDFENRIGVGAGVRWRSPVGPVRVDIAHGLDDPEQSVRLHINIGPYL
ncbi:autotransporter assembly complex protein TamA [Alkalisalibacterium limincola]|uniref:Outer membrane protein assembly factor n=1 Tax=Alkalisalibacterium limincola TaxID=2699169 RepID=A0A5C8KSG2_9GAMM|nr:autotransporter assembly complex family protein [Alkalisalibacterium limincola]TXK62232.1 outer membrane protein assembly factor [Alkalisalibacterium limincola]